VGRVGEVERKTAETEIRVRWVLDGNGSFSGNSGVPFLNHMLDLFCRHGLFDLEVEARGDLEVDAHHTVEDLGITMGQALRQALGDKAGITRYGSALIPMDEALMLAAVDLSGRAYLVYEVDIPASQVGTLDTELVEEFLRALAFNGGFSLHVRLLSGKNSHHIVEALFKALGRSLRQAAEPDPRVKGVPSTKGILI